MSHHQKRSFDDLTCRMYIYSKFRESVKWPSPSSFSLPLTNAYNSMAKQGSGNGIQRIRVMNVTIPGPILNVTETCNRFYFSEIYPASMHMRSTFFMATIPVGCYGSMYDVCSALTQAMKTAIPLSSDSSFGWFKTENMISETIVTCPVKTHIMLYDENSRKCILTCIGSETIKTIIHAPPLIAIDNTITFEYNRHVESAQTVQNLPIVPWRSQTVNSGATLNIPSGNSTCIFVRHVSLIPINSSSKTEFKAIKFTFTNSSHNIILDALVDIEIYSKNNPSRRLRLSNYYIDSSPNSENWSQGDLSASTMSPTLLSSQSSSSILQIHCMIAQGLFHLAEDEDMEARIVPAASRSNISPLFGFTTSSGQGGTHIPISGIYAQSGIDLHIQLVHSIPVMSTSGKIYSGIPNVNPLIITQELLPENTELDIRSSLLVRDEENFTHLFNPRTLVTHPAPYPGNAATYFQDGVYVSDQIANINRFRPDKMFIRMQINRNSIGNIYTASNPFISGRPDSLIALAEIPLPDTFQESNSMTLSHATTDMGWCVLTDLVHDLTNVQIDLTDEDGHHINLRGIDWSFSIELTHV